MIREELKLPLTPIPEILNLSVREVMLKVLNEEDKETVEQSFEESRKEDKPKEDKSEKEYVCEICGKKTKELYQLRTGQYSELLPDKKVCWDCYVRLHKELYEKYGKCPECGAKITLAKWPDFKCENGHIINVNFIEIDTKKILDDAYGKVSVEEYKKLYDKYFTVRDAIEEKYNKPVLNVQLVSVDRSVTGVVYTPIQSLPIKRLKDEIREAEKEGKIFAGLEVFFKDHSKAWMNENLVEIEKPELVKEAERYLRKRIQGYTEEDETSHPTIQRTTLNKWTER